MLTNQALYEEITAAEKVREDTTDEVAKALIKMAVLQVKLLHDIRSNQVAIMEHTDVPLKKGIKKDTDKPKE